MRIHIPTKTETLKPAVEFISVQEVPLLLVNTKGHIFSVTFVKKDSSIRHLNGRLGVKKYLSGGSNTTAHLSNYITVFDVHKKAYRNVNMDTIISLTVNKQEYRVKN